MHSLALHAPSFQRQRHSLALHAPPPFSKILDPPLGAIKFDQ